MPLLERILSVVAPHQCVVCGSEGALLCQWCLPDAFPPLPSRCFRCQKAAGDYATCEKCRRSTPIKHAWVATDYAGAASKLLHAYKYDRASAAGAIIGKAISDSLPYLPRNTLVIPVPTATVRIRQRGYDHAMLIARHIARYQQLAWCAAAGRLTQSRQVGANRQQRQHQLSGAFFITQPALVKGANILIADDVVTTGATLDALAAELKKAGAASIVAAVFAQKL